MNKRISVNVALAITIIAMTITFSITWIVSMSTFENTVSNVTQLQAEYAKLSEMDTYVRNNYFGDIDNSVLFDKVAGGYMNGLGDRYSVYYTEAEYATLLAIERGEVVGVGLEILPSTEGFTVGYVYEGSPAADAGVRAGGRVVAVNGEEIRATTPGGVQSLLWGEFGTEVSITCAYGLTEEETFVIRRRENYIAPTVRTIEMTDYMFVRISGFGTSTFAEFSYVIDQIQNSPTPYKGVIFDVRGASGSFKLDVYNMIDLICPRGTVAKSVNRTGAVRVLATSDDAALDLPMVVLVNEGTAAAGELFAVSVRDLAGGRIVGTRTAGHHTIQSEPKRLADGSAITITTARLITGRDESFEGGLVPDVESQAHEGFDASGLLNLNIATDSQMKRACQVVQAMVRENGDDPGTIDITRGPVEEEAPAEGGEYDDGSEPSTQPDGSGSESDAGGAGEENSAAA